MLPASMHKKACTSTMTGAMPRIAAATKTDLTYAHSPSSRVTNNQCTIHTTSSAGSIHSAFRSPTPCPTRTHRPYMSYCTSKYDTYSFNISSIYSGEAELVSLASNPCIRQNSQPIKSTRKKKGCIGQDPHPKHQHSPQKKKNTHSQSQLFPQKLELIPKCVLRVVYWARAVRRVDRVEIPPQHLRYGGFAAFAIPQQGPSWADRLSRAERITATDRRAH